MRVALCQINNTVGDLPGNTALILNFARQAADAGADLAVFPELALNGYPPRDLVEKPSFLQHSLQALRNIVEASRSLPCGLIVGYVGQAPEGSIRHVTNSAALIDNGRILATQTKMLLPTYDVFDEWRYFQAAESQDVCTFRGTRIALTICEDAWNDKQFWERRKYRKDPVESLVQQGADFVISVNGSPYDTTKRALRRQMFSAMARRYGLTHIYCNMVGGNDQLVFDGSSFVMGASGDVLASARSFAEDLVLFDTTQGQSPVSQGGHSVTVPPPAIRESHPDETSAVYEALVLGTRDYIRKCGFKRVLLGLSGGIDSTLVACVAVDAIGRENVAGIAMPGPFSSDHSVADARSLAENLGMRFDIVPITGAYSSVLTGLENIFAGAAQDVTEENIQARLRGLTLMALSNKWGALVLTTGNKSEIAVGYCTLYGDMCGGLAVISDVPKTMVYDLCHEVNRRHGPVIPENVFVKPPSAELRPDQKDSDSLPEYPVLDRILKAYVEELKTPAQIAEEQQLPLPLVRDIANKVDRNEYKRQQAAPGLKVTTKAFGMGRRFPIAQRFSE
ncbi:MAG: NAD+ synthase [Acidobacteria bacterium]|nr:NAD+ synthase [Acidobacteriota bacterium]